MKHSYQNDCTCARCTKERARRLAQANAVIPGCGHTPSARRYQKTIRTRRPIVGSQEWAETCGDDIPSLDQPGDDFDIDY